MVKKSSKGKKGSSATHTGDYTPNDVQHVKLSDSSQEYDHPAKQKPDPQGGSYWGDPNSLGIGAATGNVTPFE